MNALLFLQILVVVLSLAVIVLWMMNVQLQKALDLEKREKQQPVLIFSFEGPEEIFSVKNVGITPVSLIAIKDVSITLLLDFPKTVTLHFDPVIMLEPRANTPLKYKIIDGGYPMPDDARNSLLPHLKASSFEAHLTYRDWQNIPGEIVIIKEKDRFFTKVVTPTEPNDKN